MMLALPTVGMRKSIDKHNVDFDSLCDWVEGGILFDGEELSKSDVVDMLLENGIYEDQDFAYEITDNAWRELRRRLNWLGAARPIEILDRRMRQTRDWRDSPGHSFCIALAYAKWYPVWARGFGSDFNTQGDLFEALTKEALSIHFPGWEIHRTGWTRTHATRLARVVEEVATRLGEAIGDIDLWIDSSAHEAGLDIVCYRSFDDNRVGVPVFLLQCASGNNWEYKLKTPDLQIWKKIILFAAEPKKAFAMPFSLSDKEFTRKCNLVDGMFLDRYRLLSAGRAHTDWVSTELKDAIIAWLEPRIELLPRAV